MFSCRAAWQRCGPLVRKAASSRLPRDVVQRRQMSSAPGGSGENIVYTILCGAAFAGGLAYLYSTLAGDKASLDTLGVLSGPYGLDEHCTEKAGEDEEEAVAEEEEVAEVATEVEAPAEEETVVEAVATAVATEAAEVVVEAAEVVVVFVEAPEVVVEAAEVVVEAAEVVVEAAQEVEAVAKEVAQVAEAVEEAAQALAEPAAVEEPAAENNGTAVAPHVEEADSS